CCTRRESAARQRAWSLARRTRVASSIGPAAGAERREKRIAAQVEHTDVVRELRERRTPLPARVDLLRTRAGERALRDEQIDDAADAFAIPTTRHALRLCGACEQVTRRADAVGRSAK